MRYTIYIKIDLDKKNKYAYKNKKYDKFFGRIKKRVPGDKLQLAPN